VTISRDAYDTVYIRARSDKDAFFAMGFAQAQDRLWQLELQRRIVQGRMSEVFGKATLGRDVWFRTLDLPSSAAAAWSGLSPEAQTSLQAYADGVNAYISEGHPLPPEFILFGIRPAPWRPTDSLGVVKLLALELGVNFRREIERFVAASQLTTSELAAIDPGYPENGPVTVRAAAPAQLAQLDRLSALMGKVESQFQMGGRYVGSNAWVVAGRLTAGGKPILANDPHLGLKMPSPWYAVDVAGDHLKVSGMALVGLPIVIFGKNEKIAWGGTNMLADVQDLYLERVNGLNPNQYWSNDSWHQFETRTVSINVKADFPAFLRDARPPVKITVRRTVHGPVISDVTAQGVFDHPVALRWTALDPDDTSYDALFRVNYAHDWTAFQGALHEFVAPALNMLYADSEGNIGYVGAGRIPLRNKGNGTLPVPGDDATYRWTGSIPPNDLPRSFNPPQGFIVSANNRVVEKNYPYFISEDWAPPARAQRIQKMIEQATGAGQPLSFPAIERMQADLLDSEAKEILPLLTALTPDTERQRQALNLLSRWDARMTTESQAAAIYTAWMRHLRKKLFSEKLRADWNHSGKSSLLVSVVDGIPMNAIQAALRPGKLNWCKIKDQDGSCDKTMKAALEEALRELTKLHGPSMENWEWGALHQTNFRHVPFSDNNLLSAVFTRTANNGGSGATVNVADATYEEGKGYLQTFGPSFRQVVQPGSTQLFVNSSGQSGNALSSHYDDHIPLYLKSRYIGFDAQQARQVLVLAPRP
jgi:penicillin amidase